MKNLLITILLGITLSCGAATYTEFYVQTTGDNLNAGSTTADGATHSYAGGTFVRATGVFTVAAGDPSADGVVAGNWVSIYTTAGATIATCVALVTNVSTTTITIDLAAIAGAVASVSEAGGAATAKVGGAWKGPNGSVSFPFGFATATLTNTAGVPRVNFKSGTQYDVTAAMTHSLVGPIRWQGYTTSVGDGGKATIDGGAAGASYIVFTLSGANNDLVDFIFGNNGNSGNADPLVSLNASGLTVKRIVVHDARRGGMALGSSGANSVVSECEVYNCNKGNNPGSAGITASVGTGTFIRCISHDNVGTSSDGFSVSANTTLIDCISESNTRHGFLTSSSGLKLIGCDFYNNSSAGVVMTLATAAELYVESCNFVKNGTYGIDSSGSAIRNGAILNCGFGTGTMTNASGNFGPNITSFQSGISTNNLVFYAADTLPWTDAPNGNFTLSLTTAKAVGRGTFTQTAGGYSGTVSYPDIGAVQGASTNSASSGGSYTFAQ